MRPVIALVIGFALGVASVCFGYFAKQYRWPAAAINLVEVVVGGYYTLSRSRARDTVRVPAAV